MNNPSFDFYFNSSSLSCDPDPIISFSSILSFLLSFTCRSPFFLSLAEEQQELLAPAAREEEHGALGWMWRVSSAVVRSRKSDGGSLTTATTRIGGR
ncbi:unnamed protein product [Linum trigynum]|uniref:Uncharacterized protein n=1 Tax=Linum trigynum TaxID=586398 RepID=A0AAV2ERI4_9ROSI